MATINRTCITCGINYHHCEGCGQLEKWRYEYCCQGCWEKSEEYIQFKFAFNKIYGRMKGDLLLNEFMQLLDFSNTKFEYDINCWICEIECEE